MNNINVLLALFLLCVAAVVLSSCKKKPNGSKLVTKNGLIYKEGSTEPYTGKEKVKVSDRIMEYEVVNGKKEGEFRIYYLDGKPQIVGQMVNNKNEGLWKYYYDSAQLESEGNFKNDMPEGEWNWYFIDGKLRETGSYTSGLREGKWLSYNETGAVISEKYFADGKEIQQKDQKVKKSEI